MKFKKKGTYEAFQYDGDFMDRNGSYYVPQWAVKARNEGALMYKNGGELHLILDKSYSLSIDVGDWVVKSEDGTIFIRRDKCFKETFCVVDEDSMEDEYSKMIPNLVKFVNRVSADDYVNEGELSAMVSISKLLLGK